jgi:cytosine/adenosine deaminase-related metal-dependent hydrolase
MALREHVRDLERLARLAPGGAPERAIAVDTPPLVDLTAVARPCPLCAGSLRLDEHAAETIDGARLRVAHVTCTSCGIARAIYFRLRETALN